MKKKEINNSGFNHIERSNTDKKKVIQNKDEKEGENNNSGLINSKAYSNKDNTQNDKDKRDRMHWFFKKMTKKLKDNKFNVKVSNKEINIKKKDLKEKRKKLEKAKINLIILKILKIANLHRILLIKIKIIKTIEKKLKI